MGVEEMTMRHPEDDGKKLRELGHSGLYEVVGDFPEHHQIRIPTFQDLMNLLNKNGYVVTQSDSNAWASAYQNNDYRLRSIVEKDGEVIAVADSTVAALKLVDCLK
jgi:hypothetical protein